MTGKGSAEDLLLPEFASSINVSKDLVSVFDCPEVDKSVAVVTAIKYPYSRQTYDMVDKLLSVERFKLHNPNNPGSKPLEITIASTILELQAITGLSLIRARKVIGADEPSKPALDFRVEATAAAAAKGAPTPPRATTETGGLQGCRVQGAGCRLVPAWLWELREGVIREAAEVARRRVGEAARGAAAWGAETAAASARRDEPVHEQPGMLHDLPPWLCDLDFLASSQFDFGFEAVGDDRLRSASSWRGARGSALQWAEARGMQRLHGWGWCVRGARRRK